MRLLYVCSDFGIPPSGTKGASVHLRAITRALAALGHEVCLLSPREGPGDEHPARRVHTGHCPPARELSRLLKPWLIERDLGDTAAKELRQLVYNAWVVEPAQKAMVDAPPDAVIERLSLFGHAGIDLADAYGVPLLVEVNAPLAQEARAFRSLQMQGLAETIEDRVLHRADAILTVSTPLAELLSARDIARDKMRVIPNGVDLRAYENLPSASACRRELGLAREFVVGFVGSLKPWHGVASLLTAFGERFKGESSARLLIVGKGPEESSLHETAGALGIADQVIFTGAVSHDRVPGLIRAMDVAVAPFSEQEQFYFSPIKLFEYMAAGTCVVAPRLGQIEEVIRDGVNGLLYPAGDLGRLGELLTLLQASSDLRDRLAAAARETVRTGYTWAHAARATIQAIEGAVGGVADSGSAGAGNARVRTEVAS